MVNWNGNRDAKLLTSLRGVSLVGTLCCAFAVLALQTGCVPPQPTQCADNAACDDGNFCNGAETCDPTNANAGTDGCVAGVEPCTSEQTCNEETDNCDNCTTNADCDNGDFCDGTETCSGGDCVAGTNPCSGATPECDEAADACVECLTDADCDDGDFCNGDETCAAGSCVAGTDPCDAGETCDEATDSCIAECASDADCNDGDFCNGEETCDPTNAAAGLDGCVAGDDPCADDGVFCNGTESCDEDTDTCSSSGDPCEGTETPVCDETAGECIAGDPCDTDADCPDDGLFCTGTESCVDGFCQSSGDPCDTANGETCNEATNVCDEPVGPTQPFTLGVDNLTGTGDADTFTAALEFNAPTGTSIATFQTSDSANGGDGTDTLTASFNQNAVTNVTTTLTSIEELSFTDLGTAALTLTGTNWSGVTSVTSASSTNTNALAITNLSALAGIGLSNTTSGINVSFQSAASSGSTDALTLTLNNAGNTTTNGTVTITTATTNGVETLNVDATGTNVLAALVQATGNTLATMNIGGTGSLDIVAALDNSVLTVDASENTGGVDVTVGTGAVTATGGTGDDTLVYGANYASTDTIDGGDGDDTLSITTAVSAPSSTQSNVSNMEALTISNAHTSATTVSRFGSGITMVNLPSGSNGGSLTIASGSEITFGDRAANNDSAGTLGVTISGVGTTDDVTMTVNDSDFGGAVTLTGVETCNLVSNVDLDGSAADGDANTFVAFTMTDTAASEVLNISGSEAITFGGNITANSITAGDFAQAFTMTLGSSALAAAGTITTGSGNDTVVGSTGADILNTGSGNDVARGGTGLDIINLGTGIDILDLEDLNAAALVAANRDTVSGMTIDGTAYSSTSGEVDAIRVGNVASNADLSDGAATAEFSSVTTPANLTASGTIAILELAWEFTSSQDLDGATDGTNLLAGCGATSGSTACTISSDGNDEDFFLIAYQSGNAYLFFANGSGGDTSVAAGEISLVAVISGGVSVGGFVTSNFQ